ncbi:B-cell receptor CD22-like [Zootoca vivipara]|uniref:B-cell receptor CD22-like n=1 Tax=Zootoca vivipara TaxID=8524 RepID=UPI00293BAB53|nr:B-cell receptor CD22-like [Zootoca vivipara]
MKHFLWLLLLAGYIYCDYPLRISPDTLVAWKGSSIVIPCQISETHHSAKVRATAVTWFFQPVWDNSSFDYNGSLLYDSSKRRKGNVMAVSPAFQDRVKFIGNLGNRDCSLMITQLQTKDSGTYGARVVASVGNYNWRNKWFRNAMLNVIDSPRDVHLGIMNDLPIKEGDTVVLRCFSGRNYSRDNWYNWVKSDHHSVEHKYSASELLIFPATSEPVTSYECEVCNHAGCTLSQMVTLDVHFAPKGVKIKMMPAGKIQEGKSVQLKCEVGKAKPQNLTYTWYKDGEWLEMDSATKELSIPEVTLAHSGRYWCEAGNSAGTSRSSPVTLSVIGFLSDESGLRKHANSLVAWKGSCVLIPCEISGTFNFATVNATAVAWYFEPFWDHKMQDYNGTLLYHSSKFTEGNARSAAFQGRVTFSGDLGNRDCSLMITQLQKSDSGRYGARVVTSVGNYPWRLKWFLDATVNVTESPPEPRLEIVPVLVHQGNTAEVICSVPYHCADVLVLLTLSGLEKHHLSPQVTMLENRITKMVRFEPTWEDNGKTVGCSLSNLDGSEISHSTMKLNVRFRPEDVQLTIMNDLPIKEGDAVMLNCSVGRSNPGNNWYNWVKSDSHTVEHNYSGSNVLAFPATPGSETSYTCEVCNSVGCTSSQTVTVDVHFAPKEVYILGMTEKVVHEFSRFQVTCEVRAANPRELKYAWYKDEHQLLQDSADNVLTIHVVKPEDSGTYHCEASNSAGPSRSPAILIDVRFETWPLHESTMRSFFFLLFLPGILGNEKMLTIALNNLAAWEGSCILIPCMIGVTYNKVRVDNFFLIWYFDPVYNETLKDYSGIMLYNGSTASKKYLTPTMPHFLDRVSFVGNLKNRNCSLKISHLQKNDSGKYGARLYGSPINRREREKWFLEAAVNINVSPPKPKIESIAEIREQRSVRVTCWVFYHCPDEPIMLTLSGLEESRMSSQKTTNKYGKVQTILSFTPTWEDHRKTLTCTLKSHNGTEISQSTMTLDVKYGPKRVKLSATPGITVQEGEKLSLACTVNSSNPGVTYQWYWKDAWKYEWTSPIKEFDSVGEQDSGVYRCKAENTFGFDSSELTINVQYPPKDVKIDVPPGIIKEGDYVVLRCSSRGNPATNRHGWYKDSESVIIGTDKELHFEAIQARDSSTYYCIAGNAIGNSKSSSVTLDVQYAPKNVQLTLNSRQPITEGDTVPLNCSVGSSNPSRKWYIWYKSEKRISSTQELYTFTASAEKVSIYQCEVCNDISCTASTPISVTTLFGPKDVKAVQEPLGLITESSSVKLRCEVREANPQKLTYIWYKEGQQLQLDSTVAILKVTPEHSGSYYCVASNQVGSAKSSPVQLNVRYGPRNVHLLLSTQDAIIEGMSVSLRCDNDAYPPADVYTWYWNEQRLQQTSRTLQLKKIQVDQSGSYHCKTSNGISEQDSAAMDITVSYSRATVLKRALIGLGSVLFAVFLLGLLSYVVQRWKKTLDPGTGRARRSGSFFVKKAKGEKLCNGNNRLRESGADGSIGFLNEGAETSISYAALRFPPSLSEERTVYASVKAPQPLDDAVIYSVVKKPELHTKGDTKPDYENVVNKSEEELHYSSLVNLGPRPHPTYVDFETDSESEESIQYASLKH